jgi:membrane protease YdiL (CAAX protease family)
MIFTGFTEEVIFRGLLQSLALRVVQREALVYVSLLFGVLHIGYLSLADVVFVSAVGLLFAYLVLWSGSILGVTLAHGITNITLFLIMPHLAEHGTTQERTIATWVIAGATLLAVIAVGILGWQARRAGRLTTVDADHRSTSS